MSQMLMAHGLGGEGGLDRISRGFLFVTYTTGTEGTLDNSTMVTSSEEFCFPVPPSLENARVKLTPWDPSPHLLL